MQNISNFFSVKYLLFAVSFVLCVLLCTQNSYCYAGYADVDGYYDQSESVENLVDDSTVYVIKFFLLGLMIGFASSPLYHESAGSYFGCGYFATLAVYLCIFLFHEDFRPSSSSAEAFIQEVITHSATFALIGGVGGLIMYILPQDWKMSINPFMYLIREKLIKPKLQDDEPI